MKWIEVGDFIGGLPPLERKIFEVLETEAPTDLPPAGCSGNAPPWPP